jgi:hypothetical protein
MTPDAPYRSAASTWRTHNRMPLARLLPVAYLYSVIFPEQATTGVPEGPKIHCPDGSIAGRFVDDPPRPVAFFLSYFS